MPEIAVEETNEQVTALRAARVERGWSVAQLAIRLRQAAMKQGHELPQENMLRSMVRRWEAGQTPRERNQLLLVEVFSRSAQDLGLGVARDATPEIDMARWGRIAEKYRPWVVQKLHGLVRDRDTAEDLTQDLLIQVGRSLHKLDPATDEHLYPYLNLQVRWTLRSHYASLAKQRETLAVPTDSSGEPIVIEQAATDELSAPHEVACELTAMRALLRELPEEVREVLFLRFVEDLKGEQIAERLGLSLHQVQKRMSVGMRALRQQMGFAVPPKPRRSDGSWAVGAREAALIEAASGRKFTSADLITRHSLEAPDAPQKWVHVLASLTREGVIEHVGWDGPRCRRRRVYAGIAPDGAAAQARPVLTAVA